ncbi:hypothetical protein DL93DRAFT_2149836 [Clavulina sp. PMI_390]|nr:hypothetical protein DL93DRAFT_2149836 [Clavulina sp. PMI_390]
MNANHQVPSAIKSARYIPNFISEEEEEYLLRKIAETPQPKWKTVSNRRLQIWGGEVLKKSGTLLPSPLPPFLTEFPALVNRLGMLGIFDETKHKAPNHVIINEYGPGQGIMPHEDGPAYHPVVATISLGSHSVFHYYRYASDVESRSRSSSPDVPAMMDAGSTPRPIHPQPVLSLLLEPRSLVITSDNLYTSHLHGIDGVDEDHFVAHSLADGSNPDVNSAEHSAGIRVANWNILGGEDEALARAVREGGVVKRSIRTSLTCRVVDKVTQMPRGLRV